MAYPNYKKGGYRNSYQSSTSQSAPRLSAADKYKDEGLMATVEFAKQDKATGKPFRIINLYNVDEESAQKIADAISKKHSVSWVDRSNHTHILAKVMESDFEDWMNEDLNAIQWILANKKYDDGKPYYNADVVRHLGDEIYTSYSMGDKEGAKELLGTTKSTAMDMWQKYLSTISDPKTLAQLQLYSRIFGNTQYGHLLSQRNVDLIRTVDPSATFVLTSTMWKKLFNRGVRANAKKLPMRIGLSSKRTATQQAFTAAKDKAGFSGYSDQDLSSQVAYGINLDALRDEDDGDTVPGYGYDVKDTYLLNGRADTFNTEMGLLNNLNGELNAAAIKDQQERNKDAQPIEGSEIMLKRTEKACSFMEKYCKEKEIYITSNSQDPSNKLADYLISYCKSMAASKANILRDDNARIYAENATQVTMILTQLGLDALKRFRSTYEYTKKEATALMTVVFDIAGALEENSQLNESLRSWIRDKHQFVKRFIKALYQIGCRIVPGKKNNEVDKDQQFKESFHRVYNKISKTVF